MCYINISEEARANELNDFFKRFECDTSQGCYDVINALNCDAINDRMVIGKDSVCRVFKNTQTNKATGPHNACVLIKNMCRCISASVAQAFPALFRLTQSA